MKVIIINKFIIIFYLAMGFSYTNSLCQDVGSIRLNNFETTEQPGTLILTWKAYDSDHVQSGYFLIEKLDKDWNFNEIGRIPVTMTASVYTTYRLEDKHPIEGENYYRIAWVNKEESKPLYSDLLVADYFDKADEGQFIFLFNEKFARYAYLKTIKEKPIDVGYFGSYRYAANILKLRRIKHTNVTADEAVADID